LKLPKKISIGNKEINKMGRVVVDRIEINEENTAI